MRSLSNLWPWFLDHLRLAWGVALVLCLLWSYADLLDHSHPRFQRYIYGWDDNHYYAWARSIALDGDIDFSNDFEYVGRLRGLGPTQEAFQVYMTEEPLTATGMIPNAYGIGVGLLAQPIFLAGRLLSGLVEVVRGIEVSPFASIYLLLFKWNNILLGFMGLALTYRILRRCHEREVAALAVLGGLLGTPLFAYLWFIPTMAHIVGFAVACAMTSAALSWHDAAKSGSQSQGGRKVYLWALASGALFGLGCSVRYPNIVMFAAPLVVFAGTAMELSMAQGQKSPWSGIAISALCFGMATLFAVAPQMLAWKTLHGTWLIHTYQGESIEAWPRHGFRVLMGARNSILIWSPLMAVSIAGLIIGATRRSWLSIAGLLVFAGFLWIYGSWHTWWLGASFGMRGFVDAGFFWIVGVAEFLAWMRRRAGYPDSFTKAARGFIGACVVWTLYLLMVIRSGRHGMDERFDLGAVIGGIGDCIAQIGDEVVVFEEIFDDKYPLFTPEGSVQMFSGRMMRLRARNRRARATGP